MTQHTARRILTRTVSRRRLLAGAAMATLALPFLGNRCREGDLTNEGVRIHFTDEGDGPPLLLHHGFMGSSQGWVDYGYGAALRDRYRVITMDARGHGKSDKPHDPAQYSMQTRAGDIRAVLDHLDIDRAVVWGYSMGGRTAFAFAQYHADRMTAMIDGAASPVSPKLQEERIRRGAQALLDNDIEAVAERFFVTPQAAARMLEGQDREALAAAQLGMLTWDGVDPATLTMPSLHYAGERDVIGIATRAAANAMPNATYVSLPGLDHLTGFANSAAVLPHAQRFLSDVA